MIIPALPRPGALYNCWLKRNVLAFNSGMRKKWLQGEQVDKYRICILRVKALLPGQKQLN